MVKGSMIQISLGITLEDLITTNSATNILEILLNIIFYLLSYTESYSYVYY